MSVIRHPNTAGAASPFLAGKNKIINGDFGVWQRGTTFNSFAGGAYAADRWVGNYMNGTVNVTQQAFTAGNPISGYEPTYYMQMARTSTAGIADYIAQRVEDVRTFAGQTVTYSFWAKMSSGTGIVGTLFSQNFGSGGSGEVGTRGASFNLTSSWARYTQSITLPSISGKTIGTSSWLGISFQLPISEGNKTWQVWGAQLEAGSVATPFTTATGTVQGELALCQRYYQRISSVNATTAYMHFGMGQAYSTSAAKVPIPLKVTMRTAPSISSTGSIGLLNSVNTAINNASLAVEAGPGNSPDVCSLVATGSSGLTAGNATTLIANANNTCYLEISAEL